MKRKMSRGGGGGGGGGIPLSSTEVPLWNRTGREKTSNNMDFPGRKWHLPVGLKTSTKSTDQYTAGGEKKERGQEKEGVACEAGKEPKKSTGKTPVKRI